MSKQRLTPVRDVLIARGIAANGTFEREHFTPQRRALVCPAANHARARRPDGTCGYFGVAALMPLLTCTTTGAAQLVLSPASPRAAKFEPRRFRLVPKRIATIDPSSPTSVRENSPQHDPPPAAVVVKFTQALAHNSAALIAARPLFYFLAILDKFDRPSEAESFLIARLRSFQRSAVSAQLRRLS